MKGGVGGFIGRKRKVASGSNIVVLVGAELREFDRSANKCVFGLILR